MEFLEIAKSRYSVRDYKSRKVEPEKLEKISTCAVRFFKIKEILGAQI